MIYQYYKNLNSSLQTTEFYLGWVPNAACV